MTSFRLGLVRLQFIPYAVREEERWFFDFFPLDLLQKPFEKSNSCRLTWQPPRRSKVVRIRFLQGGRPRPKTSHIGECLLELFVGDNLHEEDD
jgi:hypothetical protein